MQKKTFKLIEKELKEEESKDEQIEYCVNYEAAAYGSHYIIATSEEEAEEIANNMDYPEMEVNMGSTEIIEVFEN